MNTCMRFVVALMIGALIIVASASAQTPLNPLEFRGNITPAVGGWYSPNSNFGGITFDLNYDVNRAVAYGNWEYQENGTARLVYFQADIQYRSQEEYDDSGIYATLDSPTFTFIGRSDYSYPTPDDGRQAVLTGRSIRIEFHSSREATFIDNPGQSDERRHAIVSTLRGLPLVAPTDYSGDWVFVGRTEMGYSSHYQAAAILKLTPYQLSGTRIEDDPFLDYTPILPMAGARAYEVQCTALKPTSPTFNACHIWDYQAQGCSPEMDWEWGGCPSSVVLLWVNPDETGSLTRVVRNIVTGVTTFYETTNNPTLVFADHGRISTRSYTAPSFISNGGLNEGYLFRLPKDLLNQEFSP